jgi:Icc-related predicted phosphoesterase
VKLHLLGDIHGNSRSLEAVLSQASGFQVDALPITGDLVGYYFCPLAILKQLERWNCHIGRGDREEMLTYLR